MKKILIPAFILAVYALSGCTKGGELQTVDAASYRVGGLLEGSKVAPVTNNDTTKASLSGWYDEQMNDFTFTISYKKDTSIIKLDTLTGIQFYTAAPSIGSVPIRVLAAVTTISAASKTNISGSFTRGLAGGYDIPAEEKVNFINNKWYVVLVSKKFPFGVAGGQLVLTKN